MVYFSFVHCILRSVLLRVLLSCREVNCLRILQVGHLFDVPNVEIITSTSFDWGTCVVLMLLKVLVWRSPIIRGEEAGFAPAYCFINSVIIQMCRICFSTFLDLNC